MRAGRQATARIPTMFSMLLAKASDMAWSKIYVVGGKMRSPKRLIRRRIRYLAARLAKISMSG